MRLVVLFLFIGNTLFLRLCLVAKRILFKMGRKIPGKKHRTIKDPNKQREVRLAR